MKEIALQCLKHENTITRGACTEHQKTDVKSGFPENGRFGVKTAKNSDFGDI